MLAGMTVLRVVAATHVPARAACAQVHPGVAEAQTFLAAARDGHIGSYGIEVCAS